MSPFLNKKAVCTLIALLIIRRRRRRRQKRCWVNPVLRNRAVSGQFMLHNKLRECPEEFFEHYRMSVFSFDTLLSKIGDVIRKRDTVMRDSVGPEEKLAVTLRYLATGNSLRSLHLEFLLGRATVASIIRDTCTAIWEVMKGQYMREPTVEEWKTISDQHEKRVNFPHCLGAIDGKLIRIISLGSDKKRKSFSRVLMAAIDSDYYFRLIDVGSVSDEGDSNILKTTKLGKQIYQQTLNLPRPETLSKNPSGPLMPYVLAADEAFAMCENVMRPYPVRKLTQQQKVYNYRLSRAQRCAECGFGLLANKWRILHNPINVNIDVADTIIRACCILHNFVIQRDGYDFEDTLSCPLDGIPAIGTRANNVGLEIRNNFKSYFCSSVGSVPWQNRCCDIAE